MLPSYQAQVCRSSHCNRGGGGGGGVRAGRVGRRACITTSKTSSGEHISQSYFVFNHRSSFNYIFPKFCRINFSIFYTSFLIFNRCHFNLFFFLFKSIFCRMGFNILPTIPADLAAGGCSPFSAGPVHSMQYVQK